MNEAGATGPATTERSVTRAVATTGAEVAAQAAPKLLAPIFEQMPADLKQLLNWVLWVLIWNGSKWTKRPIQPSGYGASTTNPKHWSSFEHVKRAYEDAVRRGYVELREKGKPPERVPIAGVGFVFDGQVDANGLVFAGVDFDKVVSGKDVTSRPRTHQGPWIIH